jgi:hypothetical protein
MLHAGHPDESVLELYCMEKLTGNPLDAFEEHLLVCAHCQDRVSETDSFLRGMRSALAAPLPEPVKTLWNPFRYFQMPMPVWATAAVAVAGVLGVVVAHNQNLTNAPLALALTATRGGAMPVAKAGSPLDLDLDVRDFAPAASNHVQIVNADGNEVWSGSASTVTNGHMHALVNSRLGPGQYYVRIADPVGAHREYALRLGN